MRGHLLELSLGLGLLWFGASLGVPLVLAASSYAVYSDPKNRPWSYLLGILALVSVVIFWPPVFEKFEACGKTAEQRLSIKFDPDTKRLVTSYVPDANYKELGCAEFPYNLT